MKLVKRGTDPKHAVRHARCTHCKSEYEFTAADKEVRYHSDQREGSYYSFKCEVCCREVYANAILPPGAV